MFFKKNIFVYLTGDARLDDSPSRFGEPRLDESETVLRGRKNLTLRPGYLTKNRPSPTSFSFIFVFSNKHPTIFTTNMCGKMSIQYTVLGFEPMAF